MTGTTAVNPLQFQERISPLCSYSVAGQEGNNASSFNVCFWLNFPEYGQVPRLPKFFALAINDTWIISQICNNLIIMTNNLIFGFVFKLQWDLVKNLNNDYRSTGRIISSWKAVYTDIFQASQLTNYFSSSPDVSMLCSSNWGEPDAHHTKLGSWCHSCLWSF